MHLDLGGLRWHDGEGGKMVCDGDRNSVGEQRMAAGGRPYPPSGPKLLVKRHYPGVWSSQGL